MPSHWIAKLHTCRGRGSDLSRLEAAGGVGIKKPETPRRAAGVRRVFDQSKRGKVPPTVFVICWNRTRNCMVGSGTRGASA